MPRPQRTPEEIAETRADILAAAACVMAQRGYRGATISAIASAAGCSAPTLYNYFPSKDDILRGMVESVMGGFMAAFQAPVDGALSAPERIAGLMHRVYAHGVSQRNMMAAFAKLTAEACNVVLEGEKMDGERVFAEAFAHWCGQHLTPAERGGLDPTSAGYLLNGIGHAQFLRWTHEDFAWCLPDRAPDVARFFCNAVREGERE